MNTSLQVDGDAGTLLDGLTPQQLVAEIRQISAQYEQEVPGGRRRWPESIRARVLALGRLGVTPGKISTLTEISRATVFLWCRDLPRRAPRQRSRGEFVQLPAGPTVRQTNLSPTVGLPVPLSVAKPAPIALTTPDGFHFEFSGEEAWTLARAAYVDLRAART